MKLHKTFHICHIKNNVDIVELVDMYDDVVIIINEAPGPKHSRDVPMADPLAEWLLIPWLKLTNAVSGVVVQTATLVSAAGAALTLPKKKKKKKPPKEKKPRPKPGEIRLTTALDGSTLYCCPECHMAYPERGLLDQHLVGHTMERRFICDICNAALKRKDHLTRHKQSHNPERPHACSVCLKAFKRKEQLTLHFVIHSGEKRHVCNECGKGFYRKDHLRKHTRSHIARRVKAELSQQSAAATVALAHAVPAPAPAPPPPVSPS
ncbi:Zinc finger protein 484 [Eumeta japonica]|uniref:Zinc finger protein 484 n=1 Tax=Eumeta variegata TaxID=151549 RepID=A0A4C1YJM8_EUMVA|nr:Zinc finger protein 484 [Eumeta japonica]